ncbi:MAG: hypothetical protein RSC65_01545 [Malacoplasma sp.]
MYKSRQKIIVISSLSALSLIGFGLGAYFIATSFDTKEVKDKTEALYAGATAGLMKQFNTKQKNVSLGDWIFSNMPTRINFTKHPHADQNTQKYTIEFIDYRYDPLKNGNGEMICSISYEGNANAISYSISTATNLPLGNKALPLGAFSFSSENNSVSYNLKNYENSSTAILLNKITTPATPNYDTFSSNTINNSFSIVEKKYIGSTQPSATDSLVNYDVKDTSDVSVYRNKTLKISDNNFQLVFENPIANTTLNASISKDTTITTTDEFSYNISYTGVLAGSNVAIADYPSYSQFWDYISDKSIKMPSVFSTIGILNWVTKIT